jgi:molybdopterin converting factor small subunit
MMRIEVKLYGELKRYTPGDHSQFSLSLEPGATLGHVRRMLSMPKGNHVSLINGRRPDQDVKLADGDTLVFMPLIAGG